jgi:two-component system chemotaxis response regulator CheY
MDKITVLIVDDSSVMRKIIERSVRQAGLENASIIEADNGVEALDRVRSHRVDLILTDINMPVMDGLTFLGQMREQELAPGVPVVIISIEGSEQHVRQAIAVGARAYIRKPFTPEQVRDRVLPLLEK